MGAIVRKVTCVPANETPKAWFERIRRIRGDSNTCVIRRRSATAALDANAPSPKRSKPSRTSSAEQLQLRLNAALKENDELKRKVASLQTANSSLTASSTWENERRDHNKTETERLKRELAEKDVKLSRMQRINPDLAMRHQMEYIRANSKRAKRDVHMLYAALERSGSIKKFHDYKLAMDEVFGRKRPAVIVERDGSFILVLGRHGEGGYGRVAYGYHSKYDWESVVIKQSFIPDYEPGGIERMQRHFQHEKHMQIRLTKCLDRQDIPHYIKSEKDGSGHVFLISVNAGQDVSKLSGEWKLKLAGIVGKKLFHILSRMHSFGFLHRDIKPENVCIDDSGVVRLIDMGSMLTFENGSNTVKGGKTSYRDPHCSLHMGSFEVTVDKPLSALDDVWMACFTIMDLTNVLPTCWRKPWIKKEAFDRMKASKESLVSEPRTFLSREDVDCSEENVEVFVDLITYLKGKKVGDEIDYEYLKKTVARLNVV